MPARAISLSLPMFGAIALVLSGCSKKQDMPEANVAAVPVDNVVIPDDEGQVSSVPAEDFANMEIDVPGPGEPGGLPDDRTPLNEAPAAPGSAQAAATVVETYFALVEQRRFADAAALWQGKAPDIARQFADYVKIGANIGAPGTLEPGAGQVYVQVPVQLYGRLRDGRVVNGLGKVTLHRVNDVDGATAAQKKWHIAEIDAKPTPYTPE